MALKALAQASLGYPEAEEISCRRAHALLTPNSDLIARLAVWSCDLCLRWILRDVEAAQRVEGPCRAVAQEYGPSGYLAVCDLTRGWWVAEREDPEQGARIMEAAVQAITDLGWGIWRAGYLTLLAGGLLRAGKGEEALRLMDEALVWIDARGGRHPEPDVHRVRGEALLALPKAATVAAEASFRNAIAVAQGHEAKLFELRSTTSLARLLLSQGRKEEARSALGACYDWFTEGFAFPELVEARALLEEMG